MPLTGKLNRLYIAYPKEEIPKIFEILNSYDLINLNFLLSMFSMVVGLLIVEKSEKGLKD